MTHIRLVVAFGLSSWAVAISAQSPITFTPVGSFGTGNRPFSVATGDFNEDGNVDVAVACVNSPSTVLLGTGTGSLVPAATIPAGFGTVCVAVADINADLRQDLLFANHFGDTVTSWLGTGSGTFVAGPTLLSIPGSGPYYIATGDFNGDQRADVAVVNYGLNNLTVMLSGSNGSLTPAGTYPTGDGPSFVTAIDLNGDTRLDLVVANVNNPNLPSGDTVSVYLGNANGTFNPKEDYAVVDGAWQVAVADYNHDTKPDLAVTNFGSNVVSLLLGNGQGSFAPSVNYVVGGNPYGIRTADFNLDLRPDIAVTLGAGTTIAAAPTTASGTFLAPTLSSTGVTSSFAIAAADMNGDGMPDLVVTNQTSHDVTVMQNTSVHSLNYSMLLADVTPSSTRTTPINYKVYIGTTEVFAGTSQQLPAGILQTRIPVRIRGPVTIEFDGPTQLKRRRSVSLPPTTSNGGTIILPNGDVDASGEVDAADIDVVIAEFGTNHFPADLDQSGEVDAADIDTIITNFGQIDE